MRRISRANRLSVATAVLLLSGLIGILSFSGPASASGSLSVSPNTGLSNGSVVTVSGSGFTGGSSGAILECNDDPNQPTVSALGNQIPVGCSNPLNKIVTTTSGGALNSTSFTIVQGTVGPPATGTDSNGNSAAADAALYPCPPTTAQVNDGDSCIIQFGDQANDLASAPLAFSTTLPSSTTTTTTSGTTTTTTSGTTTTTTSGTTTTTSANGGTSCSTTQTVTQGSSVIVTPTCNFAPNAAVTITMNGAIYGTGTASSTGTFPESFAATDPHVSLNGGTVTAVTSGATNTFVIRGNNTAGGVNTATTLLAVAVPASPATQNPSGTSGTTLADGTLAFTGSGPDTWFLLVGGLLLLNIGFLVLTMYYRPREMLAVAGRQVRRMFGGE